MSTCLPVSEPANSYRGSQCRQCLFFNFPASTVCPGCMSLDVERRALTPRGTLYSFSSIVLDDRKAFVGYVDLPEKVRVFGRLDGFDAGSPPACDMQLVLLETRQPGAGPQFVFGVAPGGESLQ